MQDRYAFDVGDYGKLGLLRHLIAETGLVLGVLWWITALGSPGNDGKHLGYLSDQRFRRCDPWLWDEMAKLVSKGRSVAALEPLLPLGTRCHGVPVPSPTRRRTWLTEGLADVSPPMGAGLVFCDPDNGVWFRGTTCRSRRHVGLEEVATLWQAGHSLVLYHHLNRQSPHLDQVERGLRRLGTDLPGVAHVWGAHYRRGSSRVFFILAQPAHANRMERAMSLMSTSTWVRDEHFTVRRLPSSSGA
jgi:hypothetical protein